MKYFMSALTLTLVSTLGLTQVSGVEYERFLVPIVTTQPIPGAAGSLWSAKLLVRNGTADDVALYPFIADVPGLPTVPGQNIPKHRTLRLDIWGVPDQPGALMFIDKSVASDVYFHLRVQDLSRQSQTWGTEIPVVRDSDLRTEKISLLGVPVSDGFRYMLRVYDPDGRPDARVRVRVFGTSVRSYPFGEEDQLLGESEIPLRPPYPGHAWHVPGYAELGDFSQFASLGGYEQVLVEVEPVNDGLEIWAFVSVTNNETQHVTVITPQ